MPRRAREPPHGREQPRARPAAHGARGQKEPGSAEPAAAWPEHSPAWAPGSAGAEVQATAKPSWRGRSAVCQELLDCLTPTGAVTTNSMENIWELLNGSANALSHGAQPHQDVCSIQTAGEIEPGIIPGTRAGWISPKPEFVTLLHLQLQDIQGAELTQAPSGRSVCRKPALSWPYPVQGWRKPRWFLSTTKAEALQTLPVETRVALLIWRPKPCLCHFPTQIKSKSERLGKFTLSSWGAGAEGTPTLHKQQDPPSPPLLWLTASTGTGSI